MDTEKFMGEIQRAIKNSDPKMTENEISSELLYHLKVDGNDRNNIERLISHAILNGPAQVTSVAIGMAFEYDIGWAKGIIREFLKTFAGTEFERQNRDQVSWWRKLGI